MSLHPAVPLLFASLDLTDFKLQLTSTDYGNFLANEPSPISTSTISEKATERLVDEFNYLKSNAGGDLSKFLDYITYVLKCRKAGRGLADRDY